MRLKLYRARDVAAAMAQVRAELGPDALILSTRRAGDGVEVTAALEDVLPPPVVPAAPADPAREAMLAWHGVPAVLARELLRGALAEALRAGFGFAPLPLAPGEAPLLLAGPPGAGKTLTAAKLATRLVLAGHSPLVVTADGKRAGATEQLAAFTRLLGLQLIVAHNPVTVARALTRRQAAAPVIIDGPGSDPFDPAQRDEVAGLASASGARTALVLPAGLCPAEAGELGAAYAELGASLLIATRLDLARRLGGVLAAADAGGLALAEGGIGPGVADGLAALTPETLAERLAATAAARQPQTQRSAA
jgi:flagellar biosynthesis protein FlhF